MTITAIFVALAALVAGVLAWYHKKYPQPPEVEPLPPEPLPVPPPAPEPPPEQPVDRVKLCALAQQQFEGWYLPGSTHGGVLYPKGSPSFQRNNPGNIKGLDGKFLVFKTYEAGFEYLCQYIRNVATGKHKAYPRGGDTTIMQYAHIYTGDAEPAPTNYGVAIAKTVGLSTDAPMKALLA